MLEDARVGVRLLDPVPVRGVDRLAVQLGLRSVVADGKVRRLSEEGFAVLAVGAAGLAGLAVMRACGGPGKGRVSSSKRDLLAGECDFEPVPIVDVGGIVPAVNLSPLDCGVFFGSTVNQPRSTRRGGDDAHRFDPFAPRASDVLLRRPFPCWPRGIPRRWSCPR